MSGRRIVFIDRDGTLNEEPPDETVDSLAKIRFMPGAVAALLDLKRAGYSFVMVTNQDGLGTARFPQEAFDVPHRFILDMFRTQGIEFEQVFVCPHYKHEACECRKPKLGMVRDFIAANPLDKAASFMVGDRDTDLEFAANLGIEGLRISRDGPEAETWPAIAMRIIGAARRATLHRRTKETDIVVTIDLSREAAPGEGAPGEAGPRDGARRLAGPRDGARRLAGPPISTGLGFFDHMLEQVARHGGFSLELVCQGDLHVDEHHTVEDCALALGAAFRQALGDKRGIARYGFLLAMDEAQAQVALDISGRPFFVWEGSLARDRVGQLPTELVPHFFRSFAEALGAALHISVRGDNTHHMVESCFKGVGRCLRQAIRLEGTELPTTKGML